MIVTRSEDSESQLRIRAVCTQHYITYPVYDTKMKKKIKTVDKSREVLQKPSKLFSLLSHDKKKTLTKPSIYRIPHGLFKQQGEVSVLLRLETRP